MAPLPSFGRLGYLPPGWHDASTSSFRERCVEDMPAFAGPGRVECPHRAKLFDGYLRLAEALALLDIATEQWIGGSFASSRDQPTDIDIVNFCDAAALAALEPELRAMLDRYLDGERTASHCGCDSRVVPKGPPDHPCSGDYLVQFNFWKKRFGHDWKGRPKGIIGLTIQARAPETMEGHDDATA